MSINTPDYEIADPVEVSTGAQLRAFADPLWMTLLDLVLERAGTVGELARAVDRPKSTGAHLVKMLVDAGRMRVVRTRRVCAIDERFHGRTGRMIYTPSVAGPVLGSTPPIVDERTGIGDGSGSIM